LAISFLPLFDPPQKRKNVPKKKKKKRATLYFSETTVGTSSDRGSPSLPRIDSPRRWKAHAPCHSSGDRAQLVKLTWTSLRSLISRISSRSDTNSDRIKEQINLNSEQIQTPKKQTNLTSEYGQMIMN
jgi:hypothetical protein